MWNGNGTSLPWQAAVVPSLDGAWLVSCPESNLHQRALVRENCQLTYQLLINQAGATSCCGDVEHDKWVLVTIVRVVDLVHSFGQLGRQQEQSHTQWHPSTHTHIPTSLVSISPPVFIVWSRTESVASFPGPAFRRFQYRTVSDGKLGGAWERGYWKWERIQDWSSSSLWRALTISSFPFSLYAYGRCTAKHKML